MLDQTVPDPRPTSDTRPAGVGTDDTRATAALGSAIAEALDAVEAAIAAGGSGTTPPLRPEALRALADDLARLLQALQLPPER